MGSGASSRLLFGRGKAGEERHPVFQWDLPNLVEGGIGWLLQKWHDQDAHCGHFAGWAEPERRGDF
jgi:hypothetical protein